jgi:hypothetical protein
MEGIYTCNIITVKWIRTGHTDQYTYHSVIDFKTAECNGNIVTILLTRTSVFKGDFTININKYIKKQHDANQFGISLAYISHGCQVVP